MEFVVREDSRREAMAMAGVQRRRRWDVDGEDADAVDGRCDGDDDGDDCGGCDG